MGYDADRKLSVTFDTATYDTGFVLNVDEVWNILAVTCFPILNGNKPYCEVNGQGGLLGDGSIVGYSYEPDPSFDVLRIGDKQCSANMTIMSLSYHLSGGGINVDETATCGDAAAGCDLRIGALMSTSKCLHKVCDTGSYFDSHFAGGNCTRISY